MDGQLQRQAENVLRSTGIGTLMADIAWRLRNQPASMTKVFEGAMVGDRRWVVVPYAGHTFRFELTSNDRAFIELSVDGVAALRVVLEVSHLTVSVQFTPTIVELFEPGDWVQHCSELGVIQSAYAFSSRRRVLGIR